MSVDKQRWRKPEDEEAEQVQRFRFERDEWEEPSGERRMRIVRIAIWALTFVAAIAAAIWIKQIG
ncbi:hypothetical protein [Gorillibacterium sp. sgz500922]|uniref:hypothetical protein n=1 Tax=Gorillibacterium sp. sgz500922 TaxID=3446694 RepID=UPI003F673CFF